MLPEGDTVTQEIETEHLGEGHIDTITETKYGSSNTDKIDNNPSIAEFIFIRYLSLSIYFTKHNI